MKYLVASLGSAGDLHPFLAVARALARAGHEVEVMSNAPYEDAVRREGLAFSALCTERDHRRTAEHPELWHPIRGFGVLWRHLAVPAIEPVRARIAARLEGTPDLRVLASPLAVGARIARAQRSFGLCSLYTAPANLRSTGEPMYLGDRRIPAWTPRPLRRLLWRLLDWRKLEPMGRPAIDAACVAAGVPRPEGSLFGDWIHSPDGGLTLFPASFCELQPDWPSGVRDGQFPLFRATGDDTLPPSLVQFLAAGPRPVVVFAGSAPGDLGRRLLDDSLMACQALGLRVAALGPAASAGVVSAKEDPEFVLRLAHAPLDLLLPHAQVFVHPGGIGSCAQGLRARIPQLIRPFAFDQHDNGHRIEADGAGLVVPHGPGSRVALLRALESLTTSGGAIRPYFDDADPDGDGAVLDALARWEARPHGPAGSHVL